MLDMIKMFLDNLVHTVKGEYDSIDRNTIRSASLGHNRDVGSSTENSKKRVRRMLAWKTQIWEKPRQPSDCKISLCEDYNDGEQRQQPLAPLLRH